jgi:hypothetical protein
MDDARCRLLAEGANPDPGTPTIYTGKLGRDIGLNAAAGLAHGIEQGAAVQHTHDLCMQAAGYVARAVGAPQPAAAASVGAPTPLAPGTAPSPTPATYAAAAAPLSPAAALVPPPSPHAEEGRIVLFPVMIYNPYHPHWTIDVQ